MRDFFVSYAHEDRGWAEWIAWQLEAEGYTTVLQARDFRPGQNFIVRMHEAVQEADRTIAVLSSAYLASHYAKYEWSNALTYHPDGRQRLVPVRVQAGELRGLFAAMVYIDLVDVDETTARRRLHEGLVEGRHRPQAEPGYPGGRSPHAPRQPEPHFPGERTISNLPPRNPAFAGRIDLLVRLHTLLGAGYPSAVVAAHGLGGIGKTQIALEYAHRHREHYWLRWVVPARSRLTIESSLSELASRVGLTAEPNLEGMVTAIREYLDASQRWLLVFDDAKEPAELLPFLPSSGRGHVIITSRNPNWEEVARQLEVDLLSEADALALLRQRTGGTDEPQMARLAEELGYLPLALAQAAAYLSHTPGFTVAGYLDLFRREHQPLLREGRQVTYPKTVATTWLLNLRAVSRASPAAIELLNVCAYLGSEAIPVDVLFQGEHRDWLSPELNEIAVSQRARHAATRQLYLYSLVSPGGDGLHVHKLVQTVTRDRLARREEEAIWADRAVRLVWQAFPTPGGSEPAHDWTRANELLPHVVVAIDHGQLAPEPSANLLNQTGMYLFSRNQLDAAETLLKTSCLLAKELNDGGLSAMALHNLGSVYLAQGNPDAAQQVLEWAWQLEKERPDADAADQLGRLYNLARLLEARGDLAAAEQALERCVDECVRTFGADDPQVAVLLAELGRIRAEREDFAGAQGAAQRAVQILDALPAPDHYRTHIVMEGVGSILLRAQEWEAAANAFRRNLVSALALFPPDERPVAEARVELGVALYNAGDPLGGCQQLQGALANYHEALGPDDPDTRKIQDLVDQYCRMDENP
jgi:tetratricopeptide (TPR) repeat protein